MKKIFDVDFVFVQPVDYGLGVCFYSCCKDVYLVERGQLLEEVEGVGPNTYFQFI